MKNARLVRPLVLTTKNGDVKLDCRTALEFLHKTAGGDFAFCVKKLHGTGHSGIVLNLSEFKWIDK